MRITKLRKLDRPAGPAEGSRDTDVRPALDVGTSKWVKGLGLMQSVLAVIVLALTCYAQHVYAHTALQAAYITGISASIATLLIFVPLSAYLHFALHHSLLFAFSIDLVATLLWLAVMAVLAAYSDIVSPSFAKDYDYGTGEFYRSDAGTAFDFVRRKRQLSSAISGADGNAAEAIKVLRRAWVCGSAAAVLAGLEFLLFFLTAMLVLYRYNHGHVTQSPLAHGSAATNHALNHRHSGRGADQFEMQYPDKNAASADLYPALEHTESHKSAHMTGGVEGGRTLKEDV
ncbi:hypothetical protein MBLNU459_g0044t2 [Dothideomycetes sp. NU459]